MKGFEPVIGLEVHAQLKTHAKMFCGCSTVFGNEPNSQTCPVCLGMPGVLPVLNRKAIEYALKICLATECTIAPRSIFARKNYFYPDLPKAYQISQYEEPLAVGGHVKILVDGEWKKIGLTRIHMEEDTGKLLHPDAFYPSGTRIDFNRCGTPLLEIVSEPEISCPEEAYLYLTKLRQILLYLGICDGNMEEGSLRCDVNISLREKGSSGLGTKAELKNINSFRGAEKALQFEIMRQEALLERGEKVIQQTLDWDADKGIAVPIRTKEEAHDYRYFPEPDLIPVQVSHEWIENVRKELPELPESRLSRFEDDYGLPAYDAEVLTVTREVADYFEDVVRCGIEPKKAGNWVMNEVLRILNDKKIEISSFGISSGYLGTMLGFLDKGVISGKMAKELFQLMLESGKSPEQIIKEKGLKQITNTDTIETVVQQVLESNPGEVRSFLDGKEKVIGFFVGEVMKATRGKANPQSVNSLLREKLKALKQLS